MKTNQERLSKLLSGLESISYIKPEDIPNIQLYMDQVTTFMDEHLKHTKRYPDDKVLTKTMINNYAKNNLLPPPVKKKYSKEHMLMLIFIYYFKNFLSISDIKGIISPISQKFFQREKGISLDDIYREVFEAQLDNIDSQVRDMIRKLNKSNETFSEIEDEEERKILTNFTFICMLSFDIWVKKTMIENIIDHKMDTRPSKK